MPTQLHRQQAATVTCGNSCQLRVLNFVKLRCVLQDLFTKEKRFIFSASRCSSIARKERRISFSPYLRKFVNNTPILLLSCVDPAVHCDALQNELAARARTIFINRRQSERQWSMMSIRSKYRSRNRSIDWLMGWRIRTDVRYRGWRWRQRQKMQRCDETKQRQRRKRTNALCVRTSARRCSESRWI